MIEFKTYDEQVDILQSRGMVVTNREEAKKCLEQCNYYNITNAYKDIFIDKNSSIEMFESGTSFEQLQALYIFDKKLSVYVFEYALLIERLIKSKMSYVIARHHGHEYMSKYNIFEENNQERVDSLIAELERTKNKNLKKDKRLIHYNQKYNRTPFWVLVNVLSFGQISKCYALLKYALKDEMALDISRLTGKSISYKDIENSLKKINYFRNLVAHDQRVYDADNYIKVSQKHPINVKLGLTKPSGNFYGFVLNVYYFLEERQFVEFCGSIKKLLENLATNLDKNQIRKVNTLMGFPNNMLAELLK
ncbi:MAG: Abi family protein [Clostridiales bacterium]|jgi:abortive infection bacteriophage resistance protein|nr:Abi family protein [Clostridiales bacterium]